MKITTTFGTFKIIQLESDKDELLIVSSWSTLVRFFESKRVFRVNQNESEFGVYVCKQECAELLTCLIKVIDTNDIDGGIPPQKSIFYLANNLA